VNNAHVDVLLVCSPGGHLLQLLALRDAWQGRGHAWVTEPTSDTRSLLVDEQVYYTKANSERSVRELVHNLRLAWRLLGELRPAVVLTTGAAVSVPFAWLGRLRGARVVHVESLTRVHRLSLSGRLITPVAHRVYVQWPELRDRVPGSHYVGPVFSAR
jgi:UDP-N-acetylglucosamine:LPS N-acetylglucosamine transferase